MAADWSAALKLRPTERRDTARKAAGLVVQIATPQGLFFGYVRNIGPGGMCVESEARLAVNTAAQLTFRLDPECEEPLRLKGRLAWVEPARTPALLRLGFTFADPLSEEAARQLEAYL